MDCTAAQERLHDYVARELATAEAARVDAHLGGCAACALAYERWTRFRGAIQRAGQGEAVPALLRARVVERLQQAPPPVGLFGWRWLALALAALTVVFVVGAPRLLAPPPQVATFGEVSGLMAALLQDHLDHGDVADPKGVEPTAEQAEQIRIYEKKLAAALVVPERLGAGFRREQCHLCPVDADGVPHVEYREGEKTVSLYIAPAAKIAVDGRAGRDLPEARLFSARAQNESLVAWKRGDQVYVLISRQPPDTLQQLAVAFR